VDTQKVALCRAEELPGFEPVAAGCIDSAPGRNAGRARIINLIGKVSYR
jgi:hypothetical protein